jgi:hypothetical protein
VIILRPNYGGPDFLHDITIGTTLDDFYDEKSNNKIKNTPRIVSKSFALARRFIKPYIKFPMHHNSKTTQNDLLRLTVSASINNKYAEGSQKRLEIDSQLPGTSGEMLLHYIKKFDET